MKIPARKVIRTVVFATSLILLVKAAVFISLKYPTIKVVHCVNSQGAPCGEEITKTFAKLVHEPLFWIHIKISRT